MPDSTRQQLLAFYETLLSHFGPQNWWPGDTPFEVMVGAVLTQNTSWRNVEKAIENIKKKKVLSLNRLDSLPKESLRKLVKPAGYYNVKADRLKNLFTFLKKNSKTLKKKDTLSLRKMLLSVNGIGKETADSILLYALDRPIFVVDAYTRRIFSRHGIVRDDFEYDEIQSLFMNNLPRKRKVFNEYHALIVELGKNFCRAKKPLCRSCPLKDLH